MLSQVASSLYLVVALVRVTLTALIKLKTSVAYHNRSLFLAGVMIQVTLEQCWGWVCQHSVQLKIHIQCLTPQKLNYSHPSTGDWFQMPPLSPIPKVTDAQVPYIKWHRICI